MPVFLIFSDYCNSQLYPYIYKRYTYQNSQNIDLFNRVNQENGTTIIIVTHDNIVKRLVNRVVSIQDGKISTESIRTSYATELENLYDNFGISNTHEEFSVVDKAEKVPIPQSFFQDTSVKNNEKIKVEISDGKVVLTKID